MLKKSFKVNGLCTLSHNEFDTSADLADVYPLIAQSDISYYANTHSKFPNETEHQAQLVGISDKFIPTCGGNELEDNIQSLSDDGEFSMADFRRTEKVPAYETTKSNAVYDSQATYQTK